MAESKDTTMTTTLAFQGEDEASATVRKMKENIRRELAEIAKEKVALADPEVRKLNSQLAAIRDAPKAAAKAAAEAQAQAERSALSKLKGGLGEESDLGNIAKTLRGAGAVAAITMILDSAKAGVDAYGAAIDRGETKTAAWVESIAKGLPIVDKIYGLAESIGDAVQRWHFQLPSAKKLAEAQVDFQNNNANRVAREQQQGNVMRSISDAATQSDNETRLGAMNGVDRAKEVARQKEQEAYNDYLKRLEDAAILNGKDRVRAEDNAELILQQKQEAAQRELTKTISDEQQKREQMAKEHTGRLGAIFSDAREAMFGTNQVASDFEKYQQQYRETVADVDKRAAERDSSGLGFVDRMKDLAGDASERYAAGERQRAQERQRLLQEQKQNAKPFWEAAGRFVQSNVLDPIGRNFQFGSPYSDQYGRRSQGLAGFSDAGNTTGLVVAAKERQSQDPLLIETKKLRKAAEDTKKGQDGLPAAIATAIADNLKKGIALFYPGN